MPARVGPFSLLRRGRNGVRGTALLALAVAVAACERAAEAPSAATPSAAVMTRRVALERGLVALTAAPALGNVGTAWFLQQLQARSPDARLAALLARSVPALRADPSIRLIDPSAPPAVLQADPPRGLLRFANYLLAPVGAPPQRAAAFVAALLAPDEQGYVLTHQLLVLIWAEQFGVAVPPDAPALRARLLARIAAEQAAARQPCSDLNAERLAVLYTFATPPPAEAAAWLDALVACQQADGRWVDATPSQLTYDGQTVPAYHEWTHTTGLAVVALGFEQATTAP
mgnify:CR=1 FL=1